MRLVARRDPRLDPRLTPDQWAAARKRYLILLTLSLVLFAAAAGAGGYYYMQSLDKTRGMQPEQVVETAGMALAKADAYRFTAVLSGESPDGFFPDAVMRGAYQREPLLLHLAGEAGAGEQKVPLEYYLEGTDLYVKNPRSATWLLVEEAEMDELYAFQPDNLAAPLVTGLRSAEVLGREKLDGGEALVLGLDLDPAVMRLQPPKEGERVEYRLWVYTRTLKPAQFAIEVSRPAAEAAANLQSSSFRYRISWDFAKMEPLAVPAEVKAQAGK
ncbi:MAG: hypothetical protein ACOY93_20855 [Bacillota bacterium]